MTKGYHICRLKGNNNQNFCLDDKDSDGESAISLPFLGGIIGLAGGLIDSFVLALERHYIRKQGRVLIFFR